ncbi:Putative mediator complex, subunit Med12 [Septoria linicola]|uniref:Mediator of RNA polymerase II transcription subunit 12 n=1 Tax=Septoria linicola TaxID=215465 RepID=A0A9Q9AJQ6_9PEZI|nr:putative mediator complex, subunit Med12 [Septoria linicola]USW50632.1 Putative mediator complex, subunit Med12 [Septoria linicola]
MDYGHRVLGGGTGQRPLPPQRAVSGSYALQQGLKRPAVPSRLNNVRSVSQPGSYVDLTSDAVHGRNAAAFTQNGGKIYTSPNVIDLSDENDERPSKRAKTGSHMGEPKERSAQDSVHQRLPGSPLPSPAAPRLPATYGRSRRPAVHRLARKANGLEPPVCATRLPAPKLVADFGPWSGQHPEDVMTEGVVKGGYYDKPPGPNSTETNSAKPTIWPNLSAKNNMGLQTLSYLFTSVIEKRQALGKCTAPSTFKPPPRVTVTDTKREAWLRDLANSEVPLRKQSRTIPHGIRGKLLMEQCLSKNIAMPRAVWLAKCVGANELRAFRRKGVSGSAAATGEGKWIREWTVQVEQFLGSVIAMCGQADWQSKMDYAVKLATAFYTERLLERDHYLDWIVSSFAQAAIDKLPIWIIMVQLYWKDITAFGKRGRLLAEAILENLQQLSKIDSRIYDTLKVRLQKLVMIMAVINRGCLIIPRTWLKYQHLLSPKTTTPDGPAQNIMSRNRRLLAPLMKTSQTTRCPLLVLYSLLDAHTFHIDIEKLSSACHSIVSDGNTLIAALLDWSASAFRIGSSRAYLAAKIMTNLHSKGVDTDSAILQYLQSSQSLSVVATDVYRVIAELARDNSFSCGRYMQWLITSGVLSGNNAAGLATGLLTALPTTALPPHLQNTRKTLLCRIPGVNDETAAIAIVSRAIVSGDSAIDTRGQVESLTTAAKYDLATSLVTGVTRRMMEDAVDLQTFCLVREVLEQTRDVRALSVFLHGTMSTSDTAMLATISDTINMHAKSFAALGTLTVMLNQIVEHYRVLRSQQPLDRALILALIALTKPFADKAILQYQHQTIAALPHDLALCEQQNSLAVCSPASDSLISMQAGSLDSDQEIDAVFASGNTMDEQLMQRVFARIVQRAGKPRDTTTQTTSRLCAWLTQLRVIDATNFEALARTYIQACMRSSGATTAALSVVSALVASGCVELDTIVSLAQAIKTSASACFAVQMLTSSLTKDTGLGLSEAYRFRVVQQRVCNYSADSITTLLIVAMEDPKFPADESGLVELLLEYSTSKYQACLRALVTAPSSTTFFANCSRLMTTIMTIATGSSAADKSITPKNIVAMADPISIVQCTAALSFLARVEATNGVNNDKTLHAAILDAITSGSDVWPQLLESGGRGTVRSIYQWAKDQLLDFITSSGSPNNDDEAQAWRYLDILCVAHHAVKDDGDAQVMASLTEKLKVICERLGEAPIGSQNKQQLTALRILLRLAVLYTPRTIAEDESIKSSLHNFLETLCVLLGRPGLQCHQDILEYIHDVACVLADSLPNEYLATLSAVMARNGICDSRLCFILGTTSNPDAWLALVSYPQPQASGGTAQAKALLQRAAQQQQQAQAAGRPGPMSGSSGSAVLQRAMSLRAGQQPQGDPKVVPYMLRRWELMSDATPSMGDNDTSLSLGLFGARKVS